MPFVQQGLPTNLLDWRGRRSGRRRRLKHERVKREEAERQAAERQAPEDAASRVETEAREAAERNRIARVIDDEVARKARRT